MAKKTRSAGAAKAAELPPAAVKTVAEKPAAKKASAAPKQASNKAAETQAAVRDILNGVVAQTAATPVSEAASTKKPATKNRKPTTAAPVVLESVAVSQPSDPGVPTPGRSKKASAPAADAALQSSSPSETPKSGQQGRKKADKPAASSATKQAPLAPAKVVPAPAPAPAPVPKPKPKPPARFSAQTIETGNASVFGDYQVRELQGPGNWRVSVRGSNPAECRCTCEDFLLGERGSCEHVEFVLGSLLDDAAQRALLEQGYQTEYSEVRLGYGARRHLRWRRGRACPEALSQAASALLDGRGRLRAEAEGALASLLAVAEESGHELRVEPAVWELLALGRDARRRIQTLEQACPQGLESPALRSLLKLPLPLYQLEAAIFAACAGRSLVADDLGLGLYAPAYAAAALLAQHFGLERVLVLCAESAQTRWLTEAQTLCHAPAQMVWGDAAARQQQCVAQAEGGQEIKIASLASLGQDLGLLKAYAPELIIVDEAQRLDAQTLAQLRQLDDGFMLMLSGQLLDEQAQALLPLLELLDRHRTGPLDRFLTRHVRRDAQGQVAGFVALEALDSTLERVMFSRSRAELQPTLPLALVQLRAVALTEQQQTLQAPLLAQLRQAVAKWGRSAYVSDAEQLRLQQLLQALRRLAIAPQLLDAGETSAEAPKLATMAALCREMLGRAVDRLVVFCQWDDALQLLAARLQAQGVAVLHLQTEARLADRQAAAGRWAQQARPAVLLCSDLAAQGLHLPLERVGLVNLELPWAEALLEQRLGCVANEHSRGLPLIQVLAQTGLEQAMLQTLDAHADVPAAGLDGAAGMHLLQGEELQRFMQVLSDLSAVLSR
ncbi:SNF2-related protein [Paucibacter sp. AS339]|uniref:SNF2-related protein n=1 Tax=Paucibacter hankyongi TaxID=3133434 RepID=UPI0030B00F50